MGAPQTLCKINMITLTKHATTVGPVLLLEEYGSLLQKISHPHLTHSEPPISDLQEWLTGSGEHEHLWKTTTYVTTAHSELTYLSLQQPSAPLPLYTSVAQCISPNERKVLMKTKEMWAGIRK